MLELGGVGAIRVERFNDLRLIPLIDESNVSVSYWSAIGIAWGLSRQALILRLSQKIMQLENVHKHE
ncbi:hypothetical protein GCM10010911_19960 [Paenibacillus nasutitermitis]|uniref:Uncharacterized protein n=1 Tax=Paenibacillus nasutitermitis TaxID=1652958 RepID=A0A916YUM6_9BACL|nr:hypothetical protein GCM10010911_19960 [Paenibacillus nasutitermitis]